MRERMMKAGIGAAIVVAVFALLGSGYYLGNAKGKQSSQTIVIEGVKNTSSSVAKAADFGAFWEAWKLLDETYLRSPEVSSKDRVRGAIRGLVDSFDDPYTQYFDPVENKQFQEDVQGNFSGIGAEIGIRKDQLVIIAPLKASPAESVGLKANDQIVFINGSSTEGISVDAAVRQIRGPRGSVVKLTIYRDTWEKPKEISITRDKIEVPTLSYEMKEGNIAYIQLYAFNANATELFADAMNKSISAGAKGMVLDLRNNPGGYLEVAGELAGWFLPKGTVVVTEESRIGEEEELKSFGSGSLKNLPLVILINGGSASASEILAGSLRDHNKTQLIGETSFGKGTVQQIMDLRDGSSVKITIAHWVLPNGQILDHDGLKPDIEVKLTDEDAEADRDPQLDKAMEVIRLKVK